MSEVFFAHFFVENIRKKCDFSHRLFNVPIKFVAPVK
jgi:hypothetical protein